MRTSNYRKFKITKKQAKLVGGAAAVAVLAGIIFFFAFFHVSKVEVMESNHYTKEELKEMVLTGAFSSNSVLAPITCSKNNVQGVPYIEGYSVSRSGRNSIVISVREKSVVGCIPYLDSYVYFDRNGMFVEGDKTRDESVPYFEGIQVKKVVMNEKLPIKDVVLNTAVALSTIFAKNDLQPDYIQLEDDSTKAGEGLGLVEGATRIATTGLSALALILSDPRNWLPWNGAAYAQQLGAGYRQESDRSAAFRGSIDPAFTGPFGVEANGSAFYDPATQGLPDYALVGNVDSMLLVDQATASLDKVAKAMKDDAKRERRVKVDLASMPPIQWGNDRSMRVALEVLLEEVATRAYTLARESREGVER